MSLGLARRGKERPAPGLDARGSACALALLAVTLGCDTPSHPANGAEALVCPELYGNVDPLEVSYAADAPADARLRVFVSTARGLADAVTEMVRLARDSCRRMSRDLGVPEASADATLQQACEPVTSAITRVKASGIEIRISLVAPRCSPDTGRESRCGSACAPAAGADCQSQCQAQSALYAQCTLPAVTVATSAGVADAVKLAGTLEQNLPALLYAEMALGRRLFEHANKLASSSARLPGDVQQAGPRGVACATLSATLIGKSVTALTTMIGVSSSLTASLDPEVHPSQGSAP